MIATLFALSLFVLATMQQAVADRRIAVRVRI